MEVGIRCGARAVGAKAEILCVIPLLMEIFRNHDHPFVITSLTEGTHSLNSLHRFGLAVDVDFREDQFTPQQGQWIIDDIARALGPDYDVVFEGNHIHVEYDPKRQPIVSKAE